MADDKVYPDYIDPFLTEDSVIRVTYKELHRLKIIERKYFELRKVVEDIADPRKSLENLVAHKGPDYKLDEGAVAMLINNPNWLKEKARVGLMLLKD